MEEELLTEALGGGRDQVTSEFGSSAGVIFCVTRTLVVIGEAIDISGAYGTDSTLVRGCLLLEAFCAAGFLFGASLTMAWIRLCIPYPPSSVSSAKTALPT